jgi:hypothetical protein
MQVIRPPLYARGVLGVRTAVKSRKVRKKSRKSAAVYMMVVLGRTTIQTRTTRVCLTEYQQWYGGGYKPSLQSSDAISFVR